MQNGTFTVYDIPAGKWKLRLKALSLSGDESDETRLELRVQPHILLSPLAILLYLLLFVLAAVGAAMLANRRAARMEDIAAHGKPTALRSIKHTSKKAYNRKRLKKALTEI